MQRRLVARGRGRRGRLHEVARGEARGEAQAPQHLREQPRRVAARAFPARQRLLGLADARLEARDVADVAREAAVQPGEDLDGRRRGHVHRGHERLEQRPSGRDMPARGQFALELGIRGRGQGEALGPWLEQEVEGIERR